MHSLMRHKVRIAAEALPTLSTFEGLLPSVGPAVPDQG